MQSYEQLEHEIAEWSGMPHVVACSSGTAALHLALEALQIPAGAKVVVPDFTMIACPRAVTLAGLEPVFVDCNERLLMDLNRVVVDEFSKVEAVMLVHIYGRRMGSWREKSDSAKWGRSQFGGIYQIEDLAEAHGVQPHPQTDAACWSFYKNKIIAGEEGGAVGFQDPKHAALARQLRSLGFNDEHDFTHAPRGCNYRLSNANASLVLSNFYKPVIQGGRYTWEYLVEARREAEIWYDDLCPAEWKMPPRDAPWVYDLRIPGMMPLRQTELVRALRAAGIEARHAFKPCHTQAEYRHCPVYGTGNAAVAAREVVYLPLTPSQVTRESAARAFEIIRRVVG